MCSVLVILGVLFKSSKHFLYSNAINPDETLHLFSLLRLRQEQDQSNALKYGELNIVMDFVSDPFFKAVANMLSHFIDRILHVNSSVQEWICVIPLIHIFKKSIQPFQDPALTSKTIKWTDESINLAQLRPTTMIKLSR